MERRIMFYGPSGTGKTTMANWIKDNYDIPFISGSISDLIPKTKELTHLEMMERDYNQIYNEDFQLLSLRVKAFRDEANYVTDRSYMDIIAYHLVKVSKGISKCDTETLLQNIALAMMRDCTHLVFVPFTKKMIHSWKIEENNKRVLNPYFQWQVSEVMKGLLKMFGYSSNLWRLIKDDMDMGKISPEKIFRELKLNNQYLNKDKYKPIKVLILTETDYDKRNEMLKKFLK